MSMVIVIGWQVYDIARLTMSTREAALQLGLIGLVQFVPLFALTLVTGWTADRIDRRLIARASIALEFFCALVLAWLAYSGTTTLLALFVVAALLGVARAFAVPALRRWRRTWCRGRCCRGRSPRARSPGNRRDRRAGPRGLSLRLGAGHALCGQRRPVRLVAALHVHDPAIARSAIEDRRIRGGR